MRDFSMTAKRGEKSSRYNKNIYLIEFMSFY